MSAHHWSLSRQGLSNPTLHESRIGQQEALSPAELPDRLDSVLQVIYLVPNEIPSTQSGQARGRWQWTIAVRPRRK